MKATFSITYEIVTHESAALGDYEECGYYAENLTLREAISKLGKHACYASDSGLESVRWLIFPWDTDYRTGAETTYNLHFPESLTPATRKRLCRYFGVK